MELGTEDASGILDLYRSDRLVVRRVATSDRDRWVVTFDNYGIGHGFDRPGFGQAWLQAQNISAIHVMGRAEDWYQYEDMEDALAAVRTAVAGASRVITYGSSMGGYAAIRFADAAGAHAALALSPQYTLDPAVASHDWRWSQDVSRIPWIKAWNGPLKKGPQVVAVYDPCGMDGWHGRRIAEDVDAVLIGLPHTAHPVATFLSEIGLLTDLVMRVLNGDLDAAAFRREARSRRRLSGVYLGELAQQQPLWRPKLAIALARRAVLANPISPHAGLSLSRLLSREGLHDEALATLDPIVRAHDREIGYLIEQGQALAMAGRAPEARALIDEVLQKCGDAAHFYGWAAGVSWIIHDVEDARRLIASAIRLDPDNQNYRLTADLYYRKTSLWGRLARWATRRREAGLRGALWPDRRSASSEPAGSF